VTRACRKIDKSQVFCDVTENSASRCRKYLESKVAAVSESNREAESPRIILVKTWKADVRMIELDFRHLRASIACPSRDCKWKENGRVLAGDSAVMRAARPAMFIPSCVRHLSSAEVTTRSFACRGQHV
jgi:hypothetical protein